MDGYYLGDKELSELPSLKSAAEKAYQMADVANPMRDLDVAEVHDLTSYHELMAYESLGFCKPGEAQGLVQDSRTSPGGELPVNPSGGVLSSNPYTATGLTRVIEAYLQVTGRAGEHQVPGARTALAHGAGGIGAQSNCVVILRDER
jgi:acetyl-CoA C-acetyltransferase